MFRDVPQCFLRADNALEQFTLEQFNFHFELSNFFTFTNCVHLPKESLHCRVYSTILQYKCLHSKLLML